MSGFKTGELSLMSCTHSWTIENFTSYCEKNDSVVSIYSPTFPLNSEISMSLLMQIDNDDPQKDDISIFYELKGKTKEPIMTQFQFYLTEITENQNFKMEPLFWNFTNDLKAYGRGGLVKKSTITDSKKLLYLPDDKFTVVCEIKIMNSKINLLAINCPTKLEKLLENQDFSDTVLKVCGQKLKVSKAILAAKSPVFYAMFCHNTKETKENLIRIDDFSFDVIKDMVKFIYTGNIENFENHVDDLLAAADKYCIEDLKTFCCNYFQEKLNVENAVEILILSNRFNAINFSGMVEKFMKSNINQILKTKGFQKAKVSHSHLLLDLVCEAIEKDK